jgi:hypothetical protein
MKTCFTTLDAKLDMIGQRLPITGADSDAEIEAFTRMDIQSLKRLHDEQANTQTSRGLLSANTGREWMTGINFMYVVFSAMKDVFVFIFVASFKRI